MNVIGIDADRRRVAVVAVINDTKHAFTIKRSNDKGAILTSYPLGLERLMLRAQAASATVFLEGIFLHHRGHPARNVETFRVLANVQGEILMMAARYGVVVHVIAPSVWQRQVLGFSKGREELKRASAAAAHALVGPGLSEHESDAACVCLYGMWALRSGAVA